MGIIWTDVITLAQLSTLFVDSCAYGVESHGNIWLIKYIFLSIEAL